MDERINFYSQNTNLLPPKPKSSFRHLKQGIQGFHKKYVLVTADKAANNVVVVCRLHCINTLKHELDGTRAYLETDTDEMYVVNAHLNDLPVKFSVCVNEDQAKLPTMYCLPKLHKRPYKARFIANSRLKAINFSWFGSELLVCCLAHRGPTVVFLFAPELVSYSAPRDLHRRAAYSICESLFLIHQDAYDFLL